MRVPPKIRPSPAGQAPAARPESGAGPGAEPGSGFGSARLKRRLVGALVCLFALWPLLQYGLTQSHGISPWRLYGWAMYSTPNLPVSVLLVESRDGRAVRIDASQVSREVLAEAKRLERRYWAYGRFSDPEPFARQVLAEQSDMEGLMVVFMRRFLSLETSMIEVRHDKFVSWREGSTASSPSALASPSALVERPAGWLDE